MARWRSNTDRVSLAVLAGFVVLAILLFRDYGISNDEEVQHRYGELIVNYYVSGFRDSALFNYKNLYLYGGLFDIVAVGAANILPFDVFLIRHFLSAMIGIAGIAGAFATARLVAGPRAGLIALIALAICGPYFGGMFNHTKDIPFAAAMIWGVYFLLRAGRDLPAPRWRDVIGFGVMLGAATGLRAMGLLLIGYAGVVVLLSVPRPLRVADGSVFLARCALRLAPAALIGYLIMIAAWPWASLAPLNPLRAIFSFAHFHYEIRTIVAGDVYRMADVPWWYVPFYLAIKIPLVVHAGALCALAVLVWTLMRGGVSHVPRRQVEIAFVAFAALFPVAAESIMEGPAFTGMRHFMFVVPLLAVLAGIGFDALLTALSPRRWLAATVASVLAAAFAWNASVLVRLHPYEYMDYNALVGGLEGASRRYEMDYWVNVMPHAVRALHEYLGLANEKSQRVYTVGVCGEKFAFENYADKRLQASPGWLEADFFIAPSQMNCDRLVDGRVIATIERFGVPIGVVKDRRGITQKALNLPFGSAR
ncbi:MAG: glycosyltransferase family 39 protein [Pseudorhodoplanes sp.]